MFFKKILSKNVILSLAFIILLVIIEELGHKNNEYLNYQKDLELQQSQIKKLTEETRNLQELLDKFTKDFSKELSFKEGLRFILLFEGGVSDDYGDSGGLTNLGITNKEYQKYRIDKKLPIKAVTQMSLSEAVEIYRRTYWLDSGCSQLLSKRIALSCFDWEVNSGRGISTLQNVLGAEQSGIPDHKTYNELKWWLTKPQNENKILLNYFNEREHAYRRWGVGIQKKFLSGWLRRAEALKKYLEVD